MDFHLVIPNPAGFDVLTPPVPVVARAGLVGVMFEVINRSPNPLRRQRLYLVAKGELSEVLAFDQITLGHLAPGETCPIRLSVRASLAAIATLTLQLAAEPALGDRRPRRPGRKA